MPVISGNTSGSIHQVVANIPSEIISYSLVNKSGGAITVTVYIIETGVAQVAITPYQVSLAVGEAYVSDIKVLVPANRSINVVVSGSCDYFFSIT
jgi:hypothetical protein